MPMGSVRAVEEADGIGRFEVARELNRLGCMYLDFKVRGVHAQILENFLAI